MCGQSTAKRRRRQAKNNFSHLAKLGRPVYNKTDQTTAARRLAELIQRENAIRQRGPKKGDKK